MSESSDSESEIINDSGYYQIYFKIVKPIKLNVGSLGICTFNVGSYIYTGSAKKNLGSRIKRHLKKNKIKQWHIDYLTTHEQVKIIKIDVFNYDKHDECELNQNTAKRLKGQFRIKGFGSSDCKKCLSHLIYLSEKTI